MKKLTLTEVAIATQGELIGSDAPILSVSTDSRTLNTGDTFVALKGPSFDGHDYIETAVARGAASLVVSRKVHSTLPQIIVPHTQDALGVIGHLWRTRFDLPIVGVTGSCGKTTVKTLIAAILKQCGETLATTANFNNEIGVPLNLLRLTPAHRYAVVEMGASQHGDIAYLSKMTQPSVALITVIAPAHLEGFGTVEGVARAKAQIFDGLAPGGTAVLNADDPWFPFLKEFVGDRTLLTFGQESDADVRLGQVYSSGIQGSVFDLMLPNGVVFKIDIKIPGQHTIQNALAAAAACYAAGIPLEMIPKGLAEAQAVKGRLVTHTLSNNICLIDDSYNANPTSMRAALQVLAECKGERILVVGDMLELGDDAEIFHHQVGEEARKLGISRLMGTGALTQKAVEGFGEGALHFPDHESLIADLKQNLNENAFVLVKGSNSSGMGKVVTRLLEDDSKARQEG